MSSPRIWLITGTSSGLGLATTEAVLARGDIVVATLRKPEAISFLTERYPASQLHVLALDVTKHADVERGFAYVREKLGRLDVVFNNAGIGFMSQLEGAPEDASRHVFEVNFWATLDVTKESIKFFREVNEPGVGGVLLQCSSVAGLVSPPSFSIYSASKHAFEAITEALASELSPKWNIRISLLEFGSFATPGYANLERKPAHTAYLDASGNSIVPDLFPVTKPSPGSPAKAGDALWRLSREKKIPLRLVLGKDAIEHTTNKAKALLQGIEENASWSDDLAL